MILNIIFSVAWTHVVPTCCIWMKILCQPNSIHAPILCSCSLTPMVCFKRRRNINCHFLLIAIILLSYCPCHVTTLTLWPPPPLGFCHHTTFCTCSPPPFCSYFLFLLSHVCFGKASLPCGIFSLDFFNFIFMSHVRMIGRWPHCHHHVFHCICIFLIMWPMIYKGCR